MGPVDVLDALHDCAERLRTKGCFAFAADLDEARAAVAELLAADAEFDRERDGYNPLFAKRDRLDRYAAAETRRAAALARCRGEA